MDKQYARDLGERLPGQQVPQLFASGEHIGVRRARRFRTAPSCCSLAELHGMTTVTVACETPRCRPPLLLRLRNLGACSLPTAPAPIALRIAETPCAYLRAFWTTVFFPGSIHRGMRRF